MEIACYSTHTVDLKNKDNTQPESLKYQIKTQRTSRKKNKREKTIKTFKKTTVSPA